MRRIGQRTGIGYVVLPSGTRIRASYVISIWQKYQSTGLEEIPTLRSSEGRITLLEDSSENMHGTELTLELNDGDKLRILATETDEFGKSMLVKGTGGFFRD